jgi:hypothetical protein
MIDLARLVLFTVDAINHGNVCGPNYLHPLVLL